MIAAEILIAPRSPDAPTVPTAAARPTEGDAFAQILAQRLEGAPAIDGQPVAAGMLAATPQVGLPGAEPTAIPATATQLAGLTLTTPATSETPMMLTAGTEAVTVTDIAPHPDTGLAAAPAAEPDTRTAAPAAAPVSPQTALPDSVPAETTTAIDPTLTEMGTPPATADAPVTDGLTQNTPPEGQADPDTDAAPTDSAPEPQPDDVTDSATSDAPAEEAPDGTAEGATNEAAPTEPTPQPQTVTLPPLAALIQPLLAPQTGAASDTPDAPGQTEVTGSTPRQRGMSGRLSTLTDSQTPTPNRDGVPSFTDRLAAAADKAQDNQPTQDAAQGMKPQDALQSDTLTDAKTQPGTAQPLPLDSRATTPTPATPQRLPDSAPLDTTQSGWEAALTDRITTRSTDLGQEIEITLNPENLGHIRIKLDLSEKAATVQIVTDTPQAAQLFQQSEARLADALNRAGLSLTSHDATARDPGGREGGQGGQRQGQGPGHPRAEAALAGLRGTLAAPTVGGRAANLVNIVA